MAQRAYTSKVVPMAPFNIGMSGERTNLDSIYYDEAFGPTPTWSNIINLADVPGYIYGNNGYNDKAMAVGFYTGDLHPGVGHNVTGAGFVFALKNYTTLNPNSVVTARMWDLNGLGETSAGPNQTGAPGTVLASATIPMSAVDTSGGITYVTWPTQVFRNAGQEYAIGIDVTTLMAGDTVAMLSSDDQEFVQSEVSWIQMSTNGWITVKVIWSGLDNVPYLLATASLKGADIPELAEYGVVLGQNYPNPANGITTIGYGVDKTTNVVFEMYDMIGNKVLSQNEGTRGDGTYKITVDTDALTAGTYFYTLTTDFGTATRKLTVTK